MSTEEKKLNIYEKLLAITSELNAVAKNLLVGVGASRYKGTGEADVLAAVKPLEEKYKVYSYPAKREIVETAELTTKSGTRNLFLRIATTYRFVNVEKPDEVVEIISYGDGVDSQDKTPGKAMTYSDKYALLKAYKIITGDDPDQNLSEDLKSKLDYKAQNKPNLESSTLDGTNTSQQAKGQEFEPMTSEQQAIIFTLDAKLQNFACKKYQIQHVAYLSKTQANHIIESLKNKGVLK